VVEAVVAQAANTAVTTLKNREAVVKEQGTLEALLIILSTVVKLRAI
jgi:hypothetical protein